MQVFCKNECKIEKKEDAEEVKLQKKKEGKGKEERRKRPYILLELACVLKLVGPWVAVK